ncbi:MAG: hypothetical protein NTW09_03275 [Candidatus Omnitrophica bacterium]|nr:hypothetical protein [Candidatus Omnitrophota bacterium]
MNKKRLSIVLAIFFLVQVGCLPQNLSAEICALNIPSRIADPHFRNMNIAADVALSIYKKHELGKISKEDIAREFFGGAINECVKFDLDDLRLGKGGWTRYYPVSILGEDLIARVFLSDEEVLQPNVKVIFEAKIENPRITCQIIPNVSDILKDCRIEPHRVYDNTEAARSP